MEVVYKIEDMTNLIAGRRTGAIVRIDFVFHRVGFRQKSSDSAFELTTLLVMPTREGGIINILAMFIIVQGSSNEKLISITFRNVT